MNNPMPGMPARPLPEKARMCCTACTHYRVFSGLTKQLAKEAAFAEGWSYSPRTGTKCPKCTWGPNER